MPVMLVAAMVCGQSGHLLSAERPAHHAAMLAANLRRMRNRLFVVGYNGRHRFCRVRLAGRDDDAMERRIVLLFRGGRIGSRELDRRVALRVVRVI